MPARSLCHVHRLIRSMSATEKRWFKRHLARNGQAADCNQARLFDAIAAMPEYDEGALLRRFQGEAFIRHFAITKRRLYEAVLRSLQELQPEATVDGRLRGLLHQVEILHGRALYADAQKVLNSALKVADAHEHRAARVAIRTWQRRLMECRNYDGVEDAAMRAVARQDAEEAEAIRQEGELWALKSGLFMRLYREGGAREPVSSAWVAQLLEHPLLADDAALAGIRARYLHHHIRSAAAFALGLPHESMRQLRANQELIEGHRPVFAEEPNLILGVMSNLAYVTVQCGLYEEAFALLKRFRALPGQWGMPETEDLDLKLFATTTSLELSLRLRLGDAEQAVALIPVVERGLRDHAQRLGPVRKALLQYECAYARFIAGQPDGALRWINALLNDTRHDDRSDVSCFARLLHLLVLHDAGKLDLLAYAHRNTERFMKLHGRQHRFEPRLLKLVAQLLHARGDADARAALTAFRDDAEALLDDPQERGVLDHMDPVAWAESRLSGRPLAACISERARRVGRAA